MRPADITAIDHDAALTEPPSVLLGQREYAHAVAAVLQGGREMAAEQAVTTGDQDLRVTTPSAVLSAAGALVRLERSRCRYHIAARRTPSRTST